MASTPTAPAAPAAPSTVHPGDEPRQEPTFIHRVLLLVAIAGGAILLAWLIGAAQSVFIMLFTGVMLASFLGALSDLVGRVTGLGRGGSLAIVVVVLLLLFVLSIWLVAPRVAEEAEQLSQEIPRAVRSWLQTAEEHRVGRWVLKLLPGAQDAAAERVPEIAGRASSAVAGTINVLGGVGVVLFAGLFFALEPKLYVEGLLKLLPLGRRARTREVLEKSGDALRRWLMGALVTGGFIGLITSAGLYLLGIPLAFTLGIITGLLTLVPNFGPIVSAIPPILLASTQGPRDMLWVVLLYVGVQLIESNVISPIVQRRTVQLAPNVVMGAQLLFGLFAGAAGLIIAAPFVAVASVAVRCLYVEDVLGDRDAETETGGGEGARIIRP